MRIFLNKWFDKFCKKEKISEEKLLIAIKEVENGLIDTDYGHGVIKKRIARENEGKSSGYRTIILYKKGDKSFFVYGFPKKNRANIDSKEEEAFKDLADKILNMDETILINSGVFREVIENGKDI